MKKLTMLLFLLLIAAPIVVNAATLSWSPVTTYTDGTAIEGTKAVSYEVSVDNVAQGTVTGTSWPIPPSLAAHDKTLSFTVRTVLSTGEVSAWTPPFTWTSPTGVPNAPGGLTVQ